MKQAATLSIAITAGIFGFLLFLLAGALSGIEKPALSWLVVGGSVAAAVLAAWLIDRALRAASPRAIMAVSVLGIVTMAATQWVFWGEIVH